MRFSLKQLEYFLAVSETKNISIASKKINISSPSISSAIAQLEEEFSIKLFIRKHASGLELTKSGEKFALAAQNIINQLLDKPQLTAEESDYLDVLCMLIYDYEKDLDIVPDMDQIELLKVSSKEHKLKHNKKNIMAALRKNTINQASEFDHNS